MDHADLQALLSQPPASFAWSRSDDGQRTIGTSAGAVLDIWPDRVVLACLFPPDDTAQVQRSTMLILLLLTALRRDWVTAPDWLTAQMAMAARARGRFEGPNYSRRVQFTFDKQHSRAIVEVRR